MIDAAASLRRRPNRLRPIPGCKRSETGFRYGCRRGRCARPRPMPPVGDAKNVLGAAPLPARLTPHAPVLRRNTFDDNPDVLARRAARLSERVGQALDDLRHRFFGDSRVVQLDLDQRHPALTPFRFAWTSW